jgi:hypothetical protein
LVTAKRGLVGVLAVPLILAPAGCNRAAPPAYAPPPPPAAETAQPPPAAPTGEQLTIARACASDIERFCAGVPPRQGMIKQCMRAHVAELSAGCFDAVMSAVAAEQAP